MDGKSGKGLSAEEVVAVARAFSSLARMDPDFSARAEVVPDAKRASAGVCALGEPAGVGGNRFEVCNRVYVTACM